MDNNLFSPLQVTFKLTFYKRVVPIIIFFHQRKNAIPFFGHQAEFLDLQNLS